MSVQCLIREGQLFFFYYFRDWPLIDDWFSAVNGLKPRSRNLKRRPIRSDQR